MKNITFSADERLIEAARIRAKARHTTLNDEFRRWLEAYAGAHRTPGRVMAWLDEVVEIAHTDGRKFTCDEMNER